MQIKAAGDKSDDGDVTPRPGETIITASRTSSPVKPSQSWVLEWTVKARDAVGDQIEAHHSRPLHFIANSISSLRFMIVLSVAINLGELLPMRQPLTSFDMLSLEGPH